MVKSKKPPFTLVARVIASLLFLITLILGFVTGNAVNGIIGNELVAGLLGIIVVFYTFTQIKNLWNTLAQGIGFGIILSAIAAVI